MRCSVLGIDLVNSIIQLKLRSEVKLMEIDLTIVISAGSANNRLGCLGIFH